MKFKSIEELLKRANELKGYSVSDLLKGAEIDLKNKGAIGNAVEYLGFGVKNNNTAAPDFPELGVELKVLPLKRGAKNQLIVKERTKVCSINYTGLIKEQWPSSSARHKLEKILFVFYEYNKDNPILSIIVDHTLFHLESNDEPLVKSDWERTKKNVEDGHAHLLSESQNVVLAASRAGAGGLTEDKFDIQPNQKYSERARKRAFSLKPSFTRTLWLELSNKEKLHKILDKNPYKNYEELKDYILNQLNKWTGRSLSEFATTHGVEINSGKNANATILRTALGFYDKESEIKEILQLGLLVKIVPCRKSDLQPWEAMSFPYQPLGELANEDRFDESDFYAMLQGFLLIPLLRETREKNTPKDVILGTSIIWRPTQEQLLIIQSEWEMCRDTVRKGIVIEKQLVDSAKGYITRNNLPKDSETHIIHMRPHARDSNDLDETIGVKISKQCFWFNKSFIQDLLTGKKTGVNS